MFAIQANDDDVWTIEGLAQTSVDQTSRSAPLPNLPALAQAFKRNHALQCGFCTPGMLIAAACLGQTTDGDLDDEKIREGLSGNICRCTGYQGIIESITEVFVTKTSDLKAIATKQ
jgi:carbon-monoxide dehydrogenase small subunit